MYVTQKTKKVGNNNGNLTSNWTTIKRCTCGKIKKGLEKTKENPFGLCKECIEKKIDEMFDSYLT